MKVQRRFEVGCWRHTDVSRNDTRRWGFSLIQNLCPLGTEETGIMEQAFESLRLSARGYYRIIRVARTIADLEGSKEIRTPHLLEAVGYRTMDHNIWEEPFG